MRAEHAGMEMVNVPPPSHPPHPSRRRSTCPAGRGEGRTNSPLPAEREEAERSRKVLERIAPAEAQTHPSFPRPLKGVVSGSLSGWIDLFVLAGMTGVA